MKVLIFLLVLSVCYVSTFAENQCPQVEEDPDEDILLPHESDCSKFYKCSHGQKILLPCPEGLHFNSELQVCDWPETANCQNVETKFYGIRRN